jgi:hypothetical protein
MAPSRPRIPERIRSKIVESIQTSRVTIVVGPTGNVFITLLLESIAVVDRLTVLYHCTNGLIVTAVLLFM